MTLPNVVSAGLLAVLLYALNWILAHIGQFSIPPEYLTIVTGLLGVAIAAVAKYVQVASSHDPAPSATARGEIIEAPSKTRRFFLG